MFDVLQSLAREEFRAFVQWCWRRVFDHALNNGEIYTRKPSSRRRHARQLPITFRLETRFASLVCNLLAQKVLSVKVLVLTRHACSGCNY